ncbi:MAG: transposase [Pseudomonadota bacterium]
MPRKFYPSEFKQEIASLVLDQGHSQKAAAEAMGVEYTASDRWVRQLRQERSSEAPEKGQAITDTQRQIQALKARIKRLEREKAILKKRPYS